MKNHVFIAGGAVCNINQSKEEIDETVNIELEETTSGLVKFEYQKIADNEIVLIYHRTLSYNLDLKEIADCDMAMASGVNITNFYLKPLGDPVIYPLNLRGSRFYSPVLAFIRFYKNLMIMMEERVEDITIGLREDKLIMKITY